MSVCLPVCHSVWSQLGEGGNYVITVDLFKLVHLGTPALHCPPLPTPTWGYMRVAGLRLKDLLGHCGTIQSKPINVFYFRCRKHPSDEGISQIVVEEHAWGIEGDMCSIELTSDRCVPTLMAHLHLRRRTQTRIPNPMAVLYNAENVHIAQTRTRIPTPYFWKGQESGFESVPESVSCNVNEPLQRVQVAVLTEQARLKNSNISDTCLVCLNVVQK